MLRVRIEPVRMKVFMATASAPSCRHTGAAHLPPPNHLHYCKRTAPYALCGLHYVLR